MSRENEFYLEAYITNLGAYTRGDLVGQWVRFPCSLETLEMVYEEIGINQLNEYGEIDEEIFITDVDGQLPSGMYDKIGEYTAIETLQVYGEVLNRINELGDKAKAAFEGLLEQFDVLDAAENLLENRFSVLEGVESHYDLGLYVFENYYDEGETFPRDKAEMYFDYEKFGQAMREDYNAYNEDTIEEYLGLDLNADDYEIGEAYVEQILGDLSEVGNIQEYVDFEAFGRDIDMNSQIIYADGFAIDYTNCEELGEDLYDEIKNDLIDNGVLPEPYEPSRDEEER